MEEILRLILEELRYHTKLIENVMSEKRDCGNREKEIKKMQNQLYETATSMFKGTPMEEKMKEMMRGVANGLK